MSEERPTDTQMEALWGELTREEQQICVTITQLNPPGLTRELLVALQVSLRAIQAPETKTPSEQEQKETATQTVDTLIEKLTASGAVEVGTCGQFGQEFRAGHWEQLEHAHAMIDDDDIDDPGHVEDMLMIKMDAIARSFMEPMNEDHIAYRLSNGFEKCILEKRSVSLHFPPYSRN